LQCKKCFYFRVVARFCLGKHYRTQQTGRIPRSYVFLCALPTRLATLVCK